jgi:hypothetical protein
VYGKGWPRTPKLSPRPAKLYPSMPSGQNTPELVLWLFQEWPTHRAGGLQPSSTPHRTPMEEAKPKYFTTFFPKLVRSEIFFFMLKLSKSNLGALKSA